MVFGLIGCFQSDYSKMVRSEIEKGVREDSLLLSINFGDTRNEFYGKCFDLNKKRLVTQGPANTSVQYLFDDSIVHKNPTQLRLLFFPEYDDKDRIAEMNMEFSYPGWAPWNKALQSDSLKIKTMQLLMHWYKGNEFVTANVNDAPMSVKVDGNRRVLVYIKDAQSVSVKVQDIFHPKYKHSIN
jgi:hypothetical protein